MVRLCIKQTVNVFTCLKLNFYPALITLLCGNPVLQLSVYISLPPQFHTFVDFVWRLHILETFPDSDNIIITMGKIIKFLYSIICRASGVTVSSLNNPTVCYTVQGNRSCWIIITNCINKRLIITVGIINGFLLIREATTTSPLILQYCVLAKVTQPGFLCKLCICDDDDMSSHNITFNCLCFARLNFTAGTGGLGLWLSTKPFLFLFLAPNICLWQN